MAIHSVDSFDSEDGSFLRYIIFAIPSADGECYSAFEIEIPAREIARSEFLAIKKGLEESVQKIDTLIYHFDLQFADEDESDSE